MGSPEEIPAWSLGGREISGITDPALTDIVCTDDETHRAAHELHQLGSFDLGRRIGLRESMPVNI